MVTVNVTLVVLALIPVLVTVQMPLELVTQVTVPVAPFDHLPVTVTLATRPSVALCTLIVTVAFHFIPEGTDERSRSPMCKIFAEVGVAVFVRDGVKVNVGKDVDVNVGRGVKVFVT